MTTKFKEVVDKTLDKVVDVWEDTTSTQTDRSGSVVARAASLLANDVDAEVVALQMTKNSKKANPDAPVVFTDADVTSYGKLFQANRTRSVLPKHQTGALIREQRATDTVPEGGEGGLAPA